MLGDEGSKDVEAACDDAFLKKIEATMLTQVRADAAHAFGVPELRCRAGRLQQALMGMPLQSEALYAVANAE